MDLAGVHVPAATPFDPVTGEVDLVALRANLRAWLEHPIRGVVLGGSTGEAVLLDEPERRAMLGAARDVVPADRLLLAGTGAESTRASLRLTREAAEAGADAVLVMPPAFYRPAMDPGALGAHYRTLADESPVPVILYQVPPAFSTLDLATGLVVDLSHHPNVVGIKDSRGDLELVGSLVDATAADFQVLGGSGAHLYASLELGAAGGVLGVANLAPAACCAVIRSFDDEDARAAGRLQERIGPLHREVVSAHGVAGVKAALDLLGLRGGEPRPPLRPLGDRERERVQGALERAGVL